MILAETYPELAQVLVGADHVDVRTAAERGVTFASSPLRR
jgi:lactate dehydrogenase-like 2-hydroxyacid dehydrogenase